MLFRSGATSPLETSETFLHCKCPQCGADATRETDTMDTFIDSSWYFLRYCDPHNTEEPFSKEKANYWMPLTKETAPSFSALAYFFAKEMYRETQVPVGIVNSSWGGSSVEAWMSEEALQKFPRQLHERDLFNSDEYRSEEHTSELQSHA